MKCEEIQLLLHAGLDQELDPANAKIFEQHLAQCPVCKAKADAFTALSRAIKAGATRHTVPPELYRRIAGIAVAKSAAPASTLSRFTWGGLGAFLSMAACVAFFMLANPGEEYLVQQQIVASHIRSLQEGHLMDIVSTDQHTVKPWFNGRLDISPPVTDLATAGFPLIGGRLDYIDNHPAAVLVYRYNKHIINLFIWRRGKSLSLSLSPSSAVQGYNMREWQKNDLQFWAISDVNAAKLAEFEQTYSAHIP